MCCVGGPVVTLGCDYFSLMNSTSFFSAGLPLETVHFQRGFGRHFPGPQSQSKLLIHGTFPQNGRIYFSVCVSQFYLYFLQKKNIGQLTNPVFLSPVLLVFRNKTSTVFPLCIPSIFFTSGIKLRANAEPAGDLPVWPFQHRCHRLSVHQGCTLATCLSVLTYYLFAIGLPDNPYNPFLTSVSVCHIHTFYIVPIYSPSKQRIVSVFVIFTK